MYDMTSVRQIKDLPDWIDKIIENTTINNSVILVMGNKLDETSDENLEQIESQRLEIQKRHRLECRRCQNLNQKR